MTITAAQNSKRRGLFRASFRDRKSAPWRRLGKAESRQAAAFRRRAALSRYMSLSAASSKSDAREVASLKNPTPMLAPG
jgi:hypothetical protein